MGEEKEEPGGAHQRRTLQKRRRVRCDGDGDGDGDVVVVNTLTLTLCSAIVCFESSVYAFSSMCKSTP